MVRKVIEEVYDDIDGTQGAETVTFAFNGTEYEVDLTEAHETELADALAKYIEAGRKVSGGRGRPVSRKPAKAAGKGSRGSAKDSAGPSTAEVRKWAQESGLNVPDRGRISGDIMVKFQEAHS